jgi:hypothetical protein
VLTLGVLRRFGDQRDRPRPRSRRCRAVAHTMFATIVGGVDGREGGRDALALARAAT